MKVLKWIFIVIIFLVIAFLIFSATQPNQLKLEESIGLNAPPDLVYEEISNFPDMDKWSVWSQMDSNMISEFSEVQGEVGSWNQWKSENPMVGNGRQEIVELRKNEYMKVAMTFEGMDDTAYAEMIIKGSGDSSRLTWTFIGGETPFYLNWTNTFLEPMIRDNYKTSLENLKGYVESMEPEVKMPEGVKVVELEAQPIISILDSTNAEGISKKLTELYTELGIFAETSKGLKVNGMPLAIYHHYSPERVVMEAAMPIEGSAKGKGRVKVSALPEGTALMGIHYGDYNASEDLHYAISDYATAAGYTMTGGPWEIYANDPTLVDSAKVETHIYYPVSMSQEMMP